MSLRGIQELFWRAIAWPTGIEDFLARADDATREAFARTFAGTPEFDRVARMGVYADAYFWRLYEVIVDQLDVTAWLAGGPRFHDFVTDYVLSHPSCAPDVRRFAADVPAALHAHALERSIPGLADVAAVEWAIVSAVDGPDAAVATADLLSAIAPGDWPALRLHAVPTAAIVPCRLAFDALHRSKAAGDAAPTAPPIADVPHAILVWRKPDLDVHYRRLDAPEARAVAGLLEGRTFAEICDAAAGPLTTDADAQTVATWLGRWLADGLLRAG